MRIADIQYNDITNGEGIVLSLWLQGCPHKCNGCHNQETWDFEKGREFTHNDFQHILNYIDKGVERDLSILGGEPLYEKNIEDLLHFLESFKKQYPSKKVYIWSGYTLEEIFKDDKKSKILNYIDILIDGKYDSKKKNITLKLRGSENQRIIDMKSTLKNKKVILFKDLNI
ncbi:anaerobic ribonucleoside-triphosphate reductase activating protein [Metaclostridioides mangenotii]|uniref:anaerobic ribonucleoside-triphosphate reductase activating protein n=1 Tax=Metaclostridioides mangenotii TaxID=1540 RepID=UPI000462EB1E|nr:anaerobic ribonucleoside-triphosphate reductase activating protein [Clostridioides mangenotii]